MYQLFYLDLQANVLVPFDFANPQNKEVYHELIQQAAEYGPVFLVKHGQDNDYDDWALIKWELNQYPLYGITVRYSKPMRFQKHEDASDNPDNHLDMIEWDKMIRNWYETIKD